MIPPWWLQVLIAALGVGGSIVVARVASRAQNRSVDATKEIGAGQLALDIAERLDKELQALRAQVGTIRVAWWNHQDWDELVLEELETLDPGKARKRVGKPPRLPFDE